MPTMRNIGAAIECHQYFGLNAASNLNPAVLFESLIEQVKLAREIG